MFPNLAGQSATYLYVQLKSFHGGQRRNPVMAPMAAALDDAAMRDLATYFASLPAKPREGAAAAGPRGALLRSEEHTSELQSLMRISYAVFCLKNKTTKQT